MKQLDRRPLVLLRLREERPVRASDLAEVCECSVRSICRDIDATSSRDLIKQADDAMYASRYGRESGDTTGRQAA